SVQCNHGYWHWTASVSAVQPRLLALDGIRQCSATTAIVGTGTGAEFDVVLYHSTRQTAVALQGLGAGTKAEFYLSWQPWLMQLNLRLVRAAPISNPTVVSRYPVSVNEDMKFVYVKDGVEEEILFSPPCAADLELQVAEEPKSNGVTGPFSPLPQ
ncbi:unnamed protein product, partial [Cyprideis torosa]